MSLSFTSWRRIWPLALVVFFASACQAEYNVLVTVNPDGSGLVSTRTTFDREAAGLLLDLDFDATGMVLDDLAQSGWVVVPPEQRADGSTVIAASKEFGTADQFSAIMDELTGPEGAFHDFELTRSKTFARVGYELTGEIDTTTDLNSFADRELQALLGRTVSEISAGYGASEEQIDLRLQVELPGGLQGDAPDGLVDSEPNQVRAEWAATLADDEITPIALRSATQEVTPLVLRGVAGLAAVLAGLAVFALILRIVLPDRRRRPGRRGKPKPKGGPKARLKASVTDAPSGTAGKVRPSRGKAQSGTDKARATGGKATASAGKAKTTAKKAKKASATGGKATATAGKSGSNGPVAKAGTNPYRVLAMDAMGVLYREADDVSTLLIPFIRERAVHAPSDEEIEAKARSLTLGRMTTGQFWASVGVDGEVAELDAAYLSRYQLMPGVIKYLRSKRASGMQVACVTNNASSWSQALRSKHDLGRLIDPWIVSGSVGVRKPDKPMFEVLRRVTGEPAAKILVIDDELTMLRAAHDLGFATAWFAPQGNPADAGVHLHIRNFETTVDLPPMADVAARADAGAKRNE